MVLLCHVLALQLVYGLHSTTQRQPTYTSFRKMHTGRADEKGAELLMFRPSPIMQLALHAPERCCLAATSQALHYTSHRAICNSLVALCMGHGRTLWASVQGLSTHMCAERASIRLAETLSSDESAQEEFIYVYDMPAEFTDDLSQLPVQWHPSQYDYDQVIFSECVFQLQCSQSWPGSLIHLQG